MIINKLKNIAAGIVLYKPDFERLNKNLKSLCQQFETIILFNNDANISEICIPTKFTNKVKIIGKGHNLGIAFALNQIMEKAHELNYKWVVTLDQDSIVPNNLISEYSKHLDNPKLGIICPQVIDKRRKYENIKKFPKEEYVDMCITSGSCTNVNVWYKVGGFDNWLFIDLVDNDFCKRIILSKYKILKLNTVILDHQYGTILRRNKYIEKFFLKLGEKLNNVNIQKLSFKRIVNPMRIYYENRNTIYLNKKFQNYGGIGYSNHHCHSYIGFFLTFSVYSWLVGKSKIKITHAIIQGIHDGRKKQVEPWSVNNMRYRKEK
ncbi:glycosyltransferase [Lactobacillus acidophilus]|uniref:glycosyltransferase n=1 Tax=Lactobacillus acidophilus TaxID=1579 RepID=UPI0021A379C6|nr:glycosyltransferase [Lactobacillus acidophilus]MCT3602866.1 glycosyltransferase [Lactobacillus acidophilus]MCT3623326.1 glycosyltransferase [Lactobacillus acidophilus]